MPEEPHAKQASLFLAKHMGGWHKALATKSEALRISLHNSLSTGEIKANEIRELAGLIKQVKAHGVPLSPLVASAEALTSLIGPRAAFVHLHNSLQHVRDSIERDKASNEEIKSVLRGAVEALTSHSAKLHKVDFSALRRSVLSLTEKHKERSLPLEGEEIHPLFKGKQSLRVLGSTLVSLIDAMQAHRGFRKTRDNFIQKVKTTAQHAASFSNFSRYSDHELATLANRLGVDALAAELNALRQASLRFSAEHGQRASLFFSMRPRWERHDKSITEAEHELAKAGQVVSSVKAELLREVERRKRQQEERSREGILRLADEITTRARMHADRVDFLGKASRGGAIGAQQREAAIHLASVLGISSASEPARVRKDVRRVLARLHPDVSSFSDAHSQQRRDSAQRIVSAIFNAL